jgi:hypothetical protein
MGSSPPSCRLSRVAPLPFALAPSFRHERLTRHSFDEFLPSVQLGNQADIATCLTALRAIRGAPLPAEAQATVAELTQRLQGYFPGGAQASRPHHAITNSRPTSGAPQVKGPQRHGSLPALGPRPPSAQPAKRPPSAQRTPWPGISSPGSGSHPALTLAAVRVGRAGTPAHRPATGTLDPLAHRTPLSGARP